MFMPILTCVTVDGVIQRASDDMKDMLGLGEITGRDIRLEDYFEPEACDNDSNARRSDPSGEGNASYGSLRRHDGLTTRVRSDSADLTFLAPGAVCHTFTVADIGSWQSHAFTYEHLAFILDHLPNPLYCKDRRGKYLWCNTAFANGLLGADRSEVVGKTLQQFADQIQFDLPPYYRHKDEELFEEGGTQVFLADVVSPVQGKRHYQFHKSVLEDDRGEIIGIVGVLTDVTERHLVAKKLMESERLYEEVFTYVREGLALVDPNDVIEYCNPAFTEIFGANSPSQLVGRSMHDFIPESTRKLVDQENLHRRQGESSEYEMDIIDLHGIRKTILSKVSPRFDTDGAYLGSCGAVSDVTEQKRLERRHAMLAAAVDAAGEVIVMTDVDGKITYANPAFERESGYLAADVIGQAVSICKSGEHPPDFYKSLWQTISSGQTWKGRFTNRRRDGALYIEDATITPIRDNSGNITRYVAVKRNVTHELEIEEQLRRSQRLESLGMLAGGIAHDFNNILTAIAGYAELVAAEIAEDESIFGDVREIIRAGERASVLVKQLLMFSSRSAGKGQSNIDICAHISDLQKMLSRMVEEHCVLAVETCHTPCIVAIDPGYLEQVIVNLVVNARDAMPEGGPITIKVFEPNSHEGPKGPPREPHGSYVAIQVSDEGVGISPEVIRRIFDPFFTTKDVGKGTGLGLSTVFGIVEEAGGEITVDSTVGEGSTFTVWLPSAGSPSDPYESRAAVIEKTD